MNRAAKITTGIAVAAVAGLVALAASPVVGAVSWASERFAPAAVESADPAEEAAEAEGLVYLGDGISRPAGGPGDCAASAFINIMSQDDGPAYGKLLGELAD